jgi:hypothetical protein
MPETPGAVERSTEEARSSRTSLRLWRTLSESVATFIPGSAILEQDGTRVRLPSSSTTQTRQALTGVSVSRKQIVGVLIPDFRQASRRVDPSGTLTSRASTVRVTLRGSGSGGAAGMALGLGGGLNQMASLI